MTFDRRQALLLTIAGTFGTIFPRIATASASPEDLIRALNADLGSVARRAPNLTLADRLESVAGLLDRYFDLARVAAGTIGSRRFREFDRPQRSLFIDRFTRFMVASYVRRLPRFDAERTEVDAARSGPPGFSTVRVRYLAADGADPAIIDFVTIERDAAWRIVDVRMDGDFSEMAVRRSEVASVLESQGFDGLIDLLETRTEDLLSQ